MKHAKRSYHPYIPLLCNLGKLEKEFLCLIPTSTLHEWKNKNFDSLFGAEQVVKYYPELEILDEYLTKTNFATIVKSIYRIWHVYNTIIKNIKIKRSQFARHKKQIVYTILHIKDIVGFDKALKAFNLTYQQFYRWKNTVTCKVDNRFICKKKHPMQLSVKETKIIKKYLSDVNFTHWPLSSIYYTMLRNKEAFMSLTTFYKYAYLFDYVRHKPLCRNKKHTLGIRASKPFEILHADVTVYRPLDNTKMYIYFIVDNFSRSILGWKASLKLSAKTTFENLREVYEKYNLNSKPDCILMTGDGSENKAEVDEYLIDTKIDHFIAQKDVFYSNSMVESSFYKLKYQFLFKKNLADFNETYRYMETVVPEFSNRPHSALYGLTPDEVMNGAIPDKNLFKHQKQLSKSNRIMENKLCIECQ